MVANSFVRRQRFSARELLRRPRLLLLLREGVDEISFETGIVWRALDRKLSVHRHQRCLRYSVTVVEGLACPVFAGNLPN
jgi:hypothetical protein